MQVERDAEAGKRLFGGLLHRALVDKAIFAAHGVLEADILGDGHLAEQRQILPDYLNAERLGHARRHGGDRLPVEVKLRAVFRLVDTGNDLDQRTLAAAVFAGKAMHFPGIDLERDAFQGANAAECDLDVLEGQERFGAHHGKSLRSAAFVGGCCGRRNCRG
ncbi:hypothetical protein D3C80_609130 [compost metagenome]